MVIRKLNELSENYKKLQGSYKELIENYISIDSETIDSGGNENTIFELKNTVEGIKSRLHEPDNQIRKLGTS